MAKKGRRPLSSARHRGAALEFIKENPGALTKEILQFLGWEHETGAKRLQRMCDLKELKRESVSVKQETSNRIVRTYRYWALVGEIFSADEVEQILAALAEFEGEKAAVEKEVLPAWHFKNNDPNRMAIPQQGGQGASGPRGFSSISQLD